MGSVIAHSASVFAAPRMNNNHDSTSPRFKNFIVLLLPRTRQLAGRISTAIAQTKQGLAGHNVGWLAGRSVLLFLPRC